MASNSQKQSQRKMSNASISVKTKYNVQHRSDLLMDEHIRNVRQVQYELHSLIQELESAKSEVVIERLQADIANLKAKSTKLVLALQVMEKINTELAFARSDLKDALHKGLGDINAARKRVIWLEDKMGELCGKKRLKTRRASNRFVTERNYDWEGDSDGEQTRHIMMDSTERLSLPSDQRRHVTMTQLLGSEIGFTSDSDHVVGRQVGFQDMSNHSYDSQEILGSNQGSHHRYASQKAEDVSFSSKDGPISSRMIDHRRSLHDSMHSLTSGAHSVEVIVEESGSDKFSTVKEMSVMGASPHVHGYNTGEEEEGEYYREEDEEEENQSYRVEQQDDMTPYDDGERQGRTAIDMRATQTPESEEEEEEEEDDDEQSARGGFDDEEEEEEEDKNKEEDDDDEEDQGDTARGDDEEERKEADIGRKDEREESTFMTEVVKLNEDEELESLHDLGAEYWQSEHHRFQYSEFKDVFTDPLSYHSVGLAVPGSFIKKEDTESEFQELPWRARRKGSDIKDVHRIALDKLANRVHNLYGKVYNAAMLSVNDSYENNAMLQRETSTSVFASREGVLKPGSSSSKSSVPQTAPAFLRQKTDDKTSLPMAADMKRGGTFIAGKLIFYPKPIPPPKVLPITRTSLHKEFPQFASSFSNPNPDERKPAERLVAQGNLLEETRLVLYREKLKPSTPGPARLERKFQRMLEKDKQDSRSSGPSGKSQEKKKVSKSFKMAGALTKLQSGMNNWNQIKPQSRGKEFFGLRWERVKTIVHMNLKSERIEERVDAAKQLGLLRCGDTMVFFALKETLHNDPEDRVKYEAAKSLILIGCWEDEVLAVILKYLVLGNTEIRTDLIQTLIDGKNVQYVGKHIPSFVELVKVLSHFCRNPDPDDPIAFTSAVCLGRLCVRDESAQIRLIKAMEESKDNHIRAKALEILVKQLTCINDNVVSHVMDLLRDSPVWKYRALACKLLIALGPTNKFVTTNFDEIYTLLENKLWDDPNMDVRLSAGKALSALGMFSKACETVEKLLEDQEEDMRAQAVISVGTLGMRSEKLVRLLLEMLELDASDYVRLMIIRTFGVLKLTDKRVLRCLREREKLDGALARESHRSLKVLEKFLGGAPRGVASPKYLKSRRLLSPILATAVG